MNPSQLFSNYAGQQLYTGQQSAPLPCNAGAEISISNLDNGASVSIDYTFGSMAAVLGGNGGNGGAGCGGGGGGTGVSGGGSGATAVTDL